MKKILLTGFEPFAQYKMNPTMTVAQELDGEKYGDYTIESVILPVDFKEAKKQIIHKINRLQPDVVLSLGLAAGRYKITPERIGINVNDGQPDNEGYRPIDSVIEKDGQDGYFTTLPIRAIVNELLDHGYPAEISNTAGTYLCNNVMYAALHYISLKGLKCKSGFIHIPASHELTIQQGSIPGWSQRDLNKAIEICIQVIVKEG